MSILRFDSANAGGYCFLLNSLALVSLLSMPSTSQADQEDRIKRILDRERIIEYRDSGPDGFENSIYATVNFKSGRTQNVVISYRPVTHVDTRLMKIFSFGYESERDSIDPEIANQVLEWNGNMKWGAWGKRYNYLVLTLFIPIESNDETVRDAVYTAASSADSKEEELTGKDKF